MSTVVGNHIGRGETKKAKEYTLVSLILLLINILGQMVIFYFFAKQLILVFTDIEEVVDSAMSCIHWYMINLLPDCTRG